mgnify:CR=1 FL=1
MKRFLTAIVMFIAGTTGAHATYPEKPIRVVISYAAGGQTDVIGRIVSQQLGKQLGQPVIVENRPGAKGSIALLAVAKASPDGYTIMFGTNGPLAINPALYDEMSIDVRKDLTAIAPVAFAPTALVVPNNSKFETADQLIKAARESKSSFTYGSAGIATTPHLSGELFRQNTKLDFLHVPYQGDAPALVDLMGGQIQLSFPGLSSALPLIRSGRIKALAVLSSARSEALPELPTMAEAGVPDTVLSGWMGFFGPSRLPENVVEALSRAVKAAVADPEVRKQLIDSGMDPAEPMTPAKFGQFHTTQIELYRDLIKSAGITQQP